MNTQQTIYMNHAGTSWPKPDEVLETISKAYEAPPEAWPELFEHAHTTVTEFFAIKERSRFLFTTSCTSALAVALADLPWQEGERILTSALEHHALMRPITKLVAQRGVIHEVAPYKPGQPVCLEFVADQLRKGDIRLIACSMASNVTGELLPVRELIELAHRHGALCLIDGAQTAGVIPIDVPALGADLFAFAGHKGPMGPQGLGGLYIAPHVVMESPTASCEVPQQGGPPRGTCSPFPSYCDLGSVNLAAALGLARGLEWLRGRGLATVRENMITLTQRLLDGLEEIAGITVYGTRDARQRTSAVSIAMADRPSGDLADRLRRQYSVIASGGYQCAPMAHETMGTAAAGTLRLSAGPFTTIEQIDAVLAAIRELTDYS